MNLQSSTTPMIHTLSLRNCLLAMLMLAVCAVTFGDGQTAQAQSADKKSDTSKVVKAKKKKLPENPFPDRPKVPAGIFDGGKAW